MNGIMAATLAQNGFTGARNAIEGPNGFLACFRRDTNVDEDEFIRNLGHPFDVIDPGMALKLYPCGSATHTAIDAALRLRTEHKISAPGVRSVRVAIPPHMAMPFPRPETGLQGKFSVHYCVGVALAHGQPKIHHFTDEAVRDPEVVALLDRMTVETTERATMEISRPSAVAVVLAGGQEVSCRIEHPKGHPANPLTTSELEDKFLYCSRDILPPERVESVIAQFRSFESLSNVQPLFSALRSSGA
jgi:2-methylcitrate dehydratase PrpD